MTQASRPETLPFSQTRLHVYASLNDIFFTPSRSVFVLIEFITVFSFFVLSWWISPYGVWGSTDDHIFVLAGLYSLIFVGLSLGVGQYERFRRFSYIKILANGILTTLLAVVTATAAAYFWYHDMFGRLTVGWGALGSLFIVTAVRFLAAYLFSFHPYKFALYETSPEIDEVLTLLNQKNFRASRYFNFYLLDSKLDAQSICDKLNAAPVYDLVVTDSFRSHPEFQKLVLETIRRGIRIVDEHSFYEDFFERIALDRFSVQTLIHREFNSRRILNNMTKRVFDILVSFIGLVVLSPLLLLIAFLIKLTSKGDILFIQPRQGRLGRQFNMYKFRTMKQEQSRKDASLGFTKQNDDRVTLIGKLLRPLHLDELPQLLNIFVGHMSIVGPRPEALAFAEKMSKAIPQYDLRYIMRPGLTGHAQLMVGYMMDTVEDTKKKLAYDLFYIINHSFAMDMRIIVRTAFVVLKKVI